MIYFITDLDDTLIYSKKSTHNCVCVDKYNGRDTSFITEQANETLKRLLSNDKFKMVPCTARSYEQTMRISFISEYQPEYMICDLGSSIYINGIKDKEWEEYLLSEAIIYPEKIINLRKQSEETIDLTSCRKIISNSDYFLVFCFTSDESASNFYNTVKTKYCENDNFCFGRYRRKIYCYPSKLDKSLAMSYLKSKFDSPHIITSGDSLFDYEFNKLGDIAVLPKHVEFKVENAFYCEEDGIKNGECILSYLDKL